MLQGFDPEGFKFSSGGHFIFLKAFYYIETFDMQFLVANLLYNY